MATRHSEEEILRQLEERLLQPDVRKSPDAVGELLADEFVEFGSSGRVFNKQQIIESLQHGAEQQMFITEFRATRLAPGVMLVTYRVVGLSASEEKRISSLRSSIWKLLDGRWKMIFHQGTRSFGV